MKNYFEEDYATYKEMEARFDEAGDAEDPVGIASAREDYRIFEEGLLSRGEGYLKLFERYREAKEKGNEYIDISEPLRDEDVAELIRTLRETRTEYFTFSSTWSGAVKTAWLFTEYGCRLEGLVRIRKGNHWILFGEDATTPAYLFSL